MTQEVLLDTSVWIKIFRGDDAVCRDALKVLDAGSVRTHPWSLLELLLGQGIPAKWLRVLDRAPKVVVVEDEALAPFIRDHRLQRSGIGLVDLQLLASAHRRGIALWTADGALARAAVDFGLPELRRDSW